jgi:hypothetical protein
MVIRLGSTVINCADLELMTGFWTQALHLAPSQTDEDGFRVLRDDHGRRLSLQLARTRSPPGTRCIWTWSPTTRRPRSTG